MALEVVVPEVADPEWIHAERAWLKPRLRQVEEELRRFYETLDFSDGDTVEVGNLRVTRSAVERVAYDVRRAMIERPELIEVMREYEKRSRVVRYRAEVV